MTQDQTYIVVVNHAGQHSLWPEAKTVPHGWWPAGFGGTREECLKHITRVWPDIRPKEPRS